MADLLNSGSAWYMADTYEIVPRVGSALRVTSADIPITLGGYTYQPAILSRSGIVWSLGLSVDTLSIKWHPGAADLINGLPLPHAINAGIMDSARVTLRRVFMSEWGDTSAGSVLLFSGRVGRCEADRETCYIPVKSDLELLNIKMPRLSYQPTCVHTVFDAGCAANEATYRVATTLLSGSTKAVLNTNIAQASGYFALGSVTFTSGANNGLSASIKSQIGSTLTLSAPLVMTPSSGDSITVLPGCDGLKSTCETKYSNLPRFRAQPWLPVPETAR